jgi:hypothetical protein
MSSSTEDIWTGRRKDELLLYVDKPELIDLFNFINTERSIFVLVNDCVLIDPKIFRWGFRNPEALKLILNHPRLETDCLMSASLKKGIRLHKTYLDVVMWYILLEVADNNLAIELLNVFLKEYIRKYGRYNNIGSLPLHYVAYKEKELLVRWFLTAGITAGAGYGNSYLIWYEETYVRELIFDWSSFIPHLEYNPTSLYITRSKRINPKIRLWLSNPVKYGELFRMENTIIIELDILKKIFRELYLINRRSYERLRSRVNEIKDIVESVEHSGFSIRELGNLRNKIREYIDWIDDQRPLILALSK